MAFPADWSYSRRIVVPATGAGSDVTLPIRITEACLQEVLEIFDADGSNPCQNGGGDIRFSSDGSTQIACDIRRCVTDNDPANGKLEAWVQHTATTATASELWIHWGTAGTSSQPAADSTYGSEAVYPSSAQMVLHMDQDPSGTAPQILDATSNDRHASSNGSMTTGDLVDAAVGKGLDLDGSNDFLSRAAVLSSATWTQEFVIRPTGFTAGMNRYLSDNGTNNNWVQLFDNNSNGTPLVRAGFTPTGSSFLDSASDLSADTDYHIAVTANASTKLMAIYINGSLSNSATLSNTATPGSVKIGSGASGFFLGNISLAHFANTDHSAAWVAVRHATLLSPGTFAQAEAGAISPDDASHGHTADSPTITQAHVVAPADALHGHTADSPTITQSHAVSPDDATHGHTADSPTVSSEYSVSPADATHGHTADSPTVTQTHVVSPNLASHGHTADSPTITQDHVVNPDNATHGHTAESPFVGDADAVNPDDASHGHTAGSPTISQTVAPTDGSCGTRTGWWKLPRYTGPDQFLRRLSARLADQHPFLLAGTITEIDEDTLTVQLNGSSEKVLVAKPVELQQSTYDGQTIGGIEYTYTDSQTRTADDGSETQTQIVNPGYSTSGPTSNITIMPVVNGTGASPSAGGAPAVYIDINGGGNQWVQEPDCE